jgi:hypothetical protein
MLFQPVGLLLITPVRSGSIWSPLPNLHFACLYPRTQAVRAEQSAAPTHVARSASAARPLHGECQSFSFQQPSAPSGAFGIHILILQARDAICPADALLLAFLCRLQAGISVLEHTVEHTRNFFLGTSPCRLPLVPHGGVRNSHWLTSGLCCSPFVLLTGKSLAQRMDFFHRMTIDSVLQLRHLLRLPDEV